MDPKKKLLEVLKQDFPDLTDAEIRLISDAVDGEQTNLFTEPNVDGGPENAASWGAERTIKAKLIYKLCADPDVTKLVHHIGIHVEGAKIDEVIDFQDAKLPYPLKLVCCAIGGIILRNAETHELDFSHSVIGSLDAKGLVTRGDVLLQKIIITGYGGEHPTEICGEPLPDKQQSTHRVVLTCADIKGELMCDGAHFNNEGGVAFVANRIKTSGGVFFTDVVVRGGFILRRADIGCSLHFEGAHFGNTTNAAFDADGLKTMGDALLSGVKAYGEVRFVGASIGSDLKCDKAEFTNQHGPAFNADRLNAKGMVSLKEVKTTGEARLVGAVIGRSLDGENAVFDRGRCAEGRALYADRINVKGAVRLRKIKASGLVRMTRSDVGGKVDFAESTFNNAGKDALKIDELVSKGSVNLNRIEADGTVVMHGARVDGSIYATRAQLNNKNITLCGSGISVNGDVNLDQITSTGAVSLPGAKVGNCVCCSNSFFDASAVIDDIALNLDRLESGGNVVLNKVKSIGITQMVGAKIASNLECTNAFFESKSERAFDISGTAIKGKMDLSNTTAKGMVRLSRVKVDGDLYCKDAKLENKYGEAAFYAMNARVTGKMDLTNSKIYNGKLNLSHATIGQLLDDKESWPKQGSLLLEDFNYSSLSGDKTPLEAKERIEWLRLQPKDRVYTQPYVHLAKLYRGMGDEAGAKNVMIAEQDDLRKYGKLRRPAWLWNWVLGKTIGHGYRPWWALAYLLGALVFGWGTFYAANKLAAMQPSRERIYMYFLYNKDGDKISADNNSPINPLSDTSNHAHNNEKTYARSNDDCDNNSDAKVDIRDEFVDVTCHLPAQYPSFNPFVYSLDVLIPLIDLHQEDFWLPAKIGGWGKFTRLYLWFHKLYGWVFTTLLFVALTGLVRKE